MFSRAKQNAPTQIESWAPVDQPSPKCCSRTTLFLLRKPVNGSSVPCSANGAGWQKYRFTRKTKRPRLGLSHGTYVDQPSPKCCSRTTLRMPQESGNGSDVLCMALMGR